MFPDIVFEEIQEGLLYGSQKEESWCVSFSQWGQSLFKNSCLIIGAIGHLRLESSAWVLGWTAKLVCVLARTTETPERLASRAAQEENTWLGRGENILWCFMFINVEIRRLNFFGSIGQLSEDQRCWKTCKNSATMIILGYYSASFSSWTKPADLDSYRVVTNEECVIFQIRLKDRLCILFFLSYS